MSLLVAYVVLAGNWLLANPALVVMAVGSLASMSQSWLMARWPVLGKLAELAAHAGVNLVGMKQALLSGVPTALPKVVAAVEAKVEAAAAPVAK
jgi:hypothetical protein